MKKLIKKIINLFYPLLQILRKIVLIIIYKFFVIIKKSNPKRILIASNTKSELYGNLLYIYDELKNYDYDLKILTINNANIFEKIKHNLKLIYYVATSKFILIDDFFPLMYVLKIRKGTKFIQVWHALGAYKRVGYSRKDIENKNSLTHKNYTDTIVSSESIIDNYAEAFGIDSSKVHAIGVPRTDLFFDFDKIQKTKENLYNKYSNLRNKRIILFAPTFRGNGRNSAYYPEEYINIDKIYQNLKENDIFIIKLHPFTKNKINIKEEYKDKIIDFGGYKDINELLLITDLLITDYSSVIHEYAFMEKPIIFYVPDLDEYNNSRSFFYDYNEYIYGTIARNEQELIDGMENAIVDLEKLNQFKLKFLNKCDGKSTKRFIEELIIKP